jgi:predicted DNA-binding transcriptional regulator AlpA
MRTSDTIENEAPLAALIREVASKTAAAVIDQIRRAPVIEPEYLSQQEAAVFLGYSEAQLCEFARRGIAPKSISFSRSAKRYRRADLIEWASSGGPSAFADKK